ncbi:hydroxypyruvate isomerase [Gallibacterium genomosp. 3]|uniref:Hydroxypyruvate isomerase n=1 Tax=Gallibacterium genomosp. 3 TaxID=505345 RepID=A0A1A7NR68_9PAST|nr:2-oxo-tetronate isomerase [Gallibacterium genomosp. 3]OBW92105.1 hydroxypyruvate isomerase [Gallibacterium genomosp. 3]
MPKFAANLSMMFKEVPFLDRFEAAAKAGFKYVEYLFPYEYPAAELKAKLDQYGLKQVLFNTAPGNVAAGEWGVSAIPGREAESHRDIDQALEYAIALGCPNVHVMAGVVPEGADRQKYQETFIQNVRYAADKFKPYGIKVLLEALSPQVKPNYLMVSQYQTLEIVEKVQRENVFVQLDYFHAQNVDGNLTRLTEKLGNKFAHIQIASVPDRHEPDEGEINYTHIFNKLDELGYDGWVGCEYNPRGKTEDGLGWFEQYKK